jgi:hypothetical protein
MAEQQIHYVDGAGYEAMQLDGLDLPHRVSPGRFKDFWK